MFPTIWPRLRRNSQCGATLMPIFARYFPSLHIFIRATWLPHTKIYGFSPTFPIWDIARCCVSDLLKPVRFFPLKLASYRTSNFNLTNFKGVYFIISVRTIQGRCEIVWRVAFYYFCDEINKLSPASSPSSGSQWTKSLQLCPKRPIMPIITSGLFGQTTLLLTISTFINVLHRNPTWAERIVLRRQYSCPYIGVYQLHTSIRIYLT